MRRKVLWILPEPEEPILVIPLSSCHQQGTLRTADELAVLFDDVTAEAGVRLVRHATERSLELCYLRQIKRADLHARILVVLSEIIGDGVGFRLSDHRVLGRNLGQIPSIALGIQWPFLTRQPPDQPGSLILAAGPHEVGRLQIEARLRLTFQPMTLDATLMNDFLRAELIARE
jgi:hypothetical protein